MNEDDGWDERRRWAFYVEAVCKMARLIGIDVEWNVASFPKGTCCGHEVKLDVSLDSAGPIESLHLGKCLKAWKGQCLKAWNEILSFSFDASSVQNCAAMMASFICSWRFQVHCGSRLLCNLENPFFQEI